MRTRNQLSFVVQVAVYALLSVQILCGGSDSLMCFLQYSMGLCERVWVAQLSIQLLQPVLGFPGFSYFVQEFIPESPLSEVLDCYPEIREGEGCWGWCWQVFLSIFFLKFYFLLPYSLPQLLEFLSIFFLKFAELSCELPQRPIVPFNILPEILGEEKSLLSSSWNWSFNILPEIRNSCRLCEIN